VSSKTLTAAETKEQLLWVAKEMLRTNLVQGTAGNLGARLPDGNAVLTPSSLDYMDMTLDDLVVCDLDGNVLEGTRGPTSEKALHLSALRQHDNIGATMHCHAKFATMFALTRQPIPAVIEEFDVFVGGDVEVADYKTTGTDELAAEVASRVGEKAAVLMANHGLFAVGKDPKDVLHIAGLVERTAEIIWGAQALGQVVPLPPEVNQTFSGYYRYGRTGKM
jgi:L-fuculose-phosphate aldolase